METDRREELVGGWGETPPEYIRDLRGEKLTGLKGKYLRRNA